MQTLIQDMQYAMRQLRNAPGFTLTAVLTLALGMGATTAIFSLIQGALRLPFPEASQLVSIKNQYPSASYLAVSYPDFQDWKRLNKSFTRIVAVFSGSAAYAGPHEPVSLNVSYISDGFFSVFGLKPIAGRGFLPAEEQKGAAHVAVLSQSFWLHEFGASQSAMGRSIVLSGKTYTIVGVVPDMVPSFFQKAQVWVPLEASPPYDQHGTNYLICTGLMKPGVSMQQAQSDMALVQSQIDKQFPDNKHGILLQPLSEALFGNVRPVMLALMAAVSFILLIACVNLANMMLARATDRMREFGIRQALGASPWRLLQQSLVESGMLAFAGGLLGLILASSVTRIPVAAWPRFLVAPADIHLSLGVLLFTAALVVLTGLIFGAVPAIQIVRQSAPATGRQDARTMSESRDQRLLRSGLMVAEIAFATLLVGGAFGTALYFASLLHTNPGIRTANVLSMTIPLSPVRYADASSQQRFFNTLRHNLDAQPGVESSGGVSVVPFSGNAQSSDYTYDGGPAPDPAHMDFADTYFVTPGYLETMQVPLLRGRLFTGQDTSASPTVIVINQSMAAKLWPHQSAIGKRIRIASDSWKLVIGVVGDVRGAGVAQPAGLQAYFSANQFPVSSLTMVMRTKGDPLELVAAAQQSVHAIDAGQIVSDVTPVAELASESVVGQTTSTALIGALGLLALLLASIGVYGVTAYGVSRREREFGIRLALGARRSQIFSMLLQSTGWLVGLGILSGVLLAIPLNGWMRSLLGNGSVEFGPGAFIGTALVLGSVALLATLAPARRAAQVEPMQAIRTE